MYRCPAVKLVGFASDREPRRGDEGRTTSVSAVGGEEGGGRTPWQRTPGLSITPQASRPQRFDFLCPSRRLESNEDRLLLDKILTMLRTGSCTGQLFPTFLFVGSL